MSKRLFTMVAVGVALISLSSFVFVQKVLAQPTIPIPRLEVSTAQSPEDVVGSLEILGILTVLALAPSILIMMTAFTRIIIVLAFVRNALGTQQMPPNQVLIGLALFLTFFVMAPIATQVNEKAVQPYLHGKIDQQTAAHEALKPIREFMMKQTREKDLALFLELAGREQPETYDDIPTHVLIPAFITSELKTAFQIGFLIYIPFIIVDMVVASTLMSMGMMMLPPVMISLPLKILLFVMVDGWDLVIKNLLAGFK
ncbi:flagellar biosynthetic protein FliP [Caldicoprobacter guelmensis]|uniref:flagellar type III secretion system pore protein FliP n=1 Tax=Caldicoprobacter guelmensis TaxID=1170224 RepID=UPI00195B6501|nr:flagellar type III secretion system pore protein FliP [Caldicoprobacter guelmensis]MBM7581394.1 flagellar biosynthetic protein FliP [Caldicoprobacter guelmensis]